MALEVFANNGTAVISSGGTDAPVAGTVESWTLSGSTLPAVSVSATPPTWCYVTDQVNDSEKMLVTNISGSTATVTRGADGTTPVAHTTGFTVNQVATRASLGALQSPAWLNVATWFSADPTGAADSTTAIQNALNAAASGDVVYLPAGTFLLNSSALTVTTSGVTIMGAGQGATIVQIGASFSGTAAINCTGANDTFISGMLIRGTSATYSSNPAADAIRLNNSLRCTVRDVFCLYINGYAVSALGNSSGSSLWTQLVNVHSLSCAQGAHILGNTASGFDAGAAITNCIFEQTAGGDALLIEDAHDVLITNLEAWNLSTSSGNSIHIKGASAAVYVNGADLGGLTGSTPQAHPVVLIEAGANGTPNQVAFNGGIIEGGTPGLSITGGTDVIFTGAHFFSNANYGLQISGTADALMTGCWFNSNGYTAGTANFDAVVSATAGVARFEQCEFGTAGGTASTQVASAVNGNGQAYVQHCRFAGAGAFGGGGGGFPKLARNNLGYNPIGPLTPPGVPASTTPLVNPFGTDCAVYITGGTVSAIAVGGTATGLTLPAVTVATVPLPWNQSVTLTYTAAPTWTWFGELTRGRHPASPFPPAPHETGGCGAGVVFFCPGCRGAGPGPARHPECARNPATDRGGVQFRSGVRASRLR